MEVTMGDSKMQKLYLKETGRLAIINGLFSENYTKWLEERIVLLAGQNGRPADESIFTKYVNVDHDNYAIVKVTQEVLEVSEAVAVNILIETGLSNILLYPDGDDTEVKKRVKEMLSEGKFPALVERLKQSWCM
jgi:hypothetical protein